VKQVSRGEKTRCNTLHEEKSSYITFHEEKNNITSFISKKKNQHTTSFTKKNKIDMPQASRSKKYRILIFIKIKPTYNKFHEENKISILQVHGKKINMQLVS